jgi:hypothetical protein
MIAWLVFALGLCLMAWLAWRLLLWVLGPFLRWYGRPRLRRQYVLDAHWSWTLALADPMAFARIHGGFADARMPRLAEPLQQSLRPALLHLLGLRSDMADDQVRKILPGQLREGWFRMGLDALRPDDVPRDAMALACARVAFATRTAALLGWLDEATQWHILHHNAQRAADCFHHWQDFGTAFARGRQQWVAHSRADSLGVAFTEDDVAQWVANRDHPWYWLPWPLPPPPSKKP